MKRLCHLISILFAAMITLCFTITAFADEKKYDIDFTREEAYAAVMNTTPTQAKNLYGGDVSYYEALTDEDKEQLFEAMWNLTESGLLYDTVHTVHLSSFVDEYFSTVIYSFEEADSDEEGLNTLKENIQIIKDEYLSEDSPEREKVNIVEKTESAETTKRIHQDVTTAEPETTETTAQVTTMPVKEQKKNNHTGLIVFVCLVAVGAAAGIGYYVIQKKSTK